MFEVLVFVYEHYWRGDACPELQQLGRKLSAHGFEPEEIHDALVWLECLGFIAFLAASGVLPSPMREIVIERAMAAPGDPVSLDDLKIIVLMVYWSFGQEPDALVLDELCEPAEGRLPH
jgi:Smg protein